MIFPLIIWMIEGETVQQTKTFAALVKTVATGHSIVEIS